MIIPDHCPDHPGLSAVTTHLPEGWRTMEESQREYHSWVECTGCAQAGKRTILKYAGTRQGTNGWET